jgi:predicted amino acid dehydrogenase
MVALAPKGAEMDKFGFVVHPRQIEDFYYYNKALKLIPKLILEQCIKLVPSFKVSEVKGVRSITGKQIGGFIIGCPLLPIQMLNLDTNVVLKKIIRAGKIAENLGAKIVGLGGYTSVVGDKGYSIAENLKIGITTGSAYTAWLALEGINRTAEARGLDLSKATVAIIGATGAIGALCAKRLCRDTAKIIITSRHIEKLEKLKDTIFKINPIEVVIEMDAHKAIENADIAITTTSAPEALLNINEFKNGAIVCDISIPNNVSGELKAGKDVKLIKGGLAKLPSDVDFGISIGLPKGLVYGCIAETMLLTFEGRFEDYSVGDNIDPSKLDEISAIAKRHGFEVAYE